MRHFAKLAVAALLVSAASHAYAADVRQFGDNNTQRVFTAQQPGSKPAGTMIGISNNVSHPNLPISHDPLPKPPVQNQKPPVQAPNNPPANSAGNGLGLDSLPHDVVVILPPHGGINSPKPIVNPLPKPQPTPVRQNSPILNKLPLPIFKLPVENDGPNKPVSSNAGAAGLHLQTLSSKK